MDTGKALAVAGLAGVVLWFLDQKLTAPATVIVSAHPAAPADGAATKAAGAYAAAEKLDTDLATAAGNAFHIPGAATLAKANPLTAGRIIGTAAAPYALAGARATVAGVKTAGGAVVGAGKSVVHTLSFGLL